MLENVQTVFDALAEPNRRAILGLLVADELSVGEIEQRLELPQPLISKHLRVLRDTGFVEARIDAQLRVYRLRPEPLIALDKWLEPYRRYWNTHLDALERHLDRMSATRTPAARSARGRRNTIVTQVKKGRAK
jgi:DNA-binding transcriptional ArsR family regulator